VELPDLKQRLIREILAISMQDNCKARLLQADGTYKRVKCDATQPRIRSQERFLEIALQNASRRLNEMPPPPLPFTQDRPARKKQRKRQTG
jgi:polyphosphate kinase